MVSTLRESDHIFTPFYVPVTQAVVVQAQASGWQRHALPKEVVLWKTCGPT